MTFVNRFLLVGTAAILGAGIVGCSKSSSTSTSPPAGGGTTLNLALPANGGSASFTFPTAGTFPYKCGIHPATMTGNSVTVSASSMVDSVPVNVVGISTPGFSPSAVTIRVGGTIRWVNNTGNTHTVVNQ